SGCNHRRGPQPRRARDPLPWERHYRRSPRRGARSVAVIGQGEIRMNDTLTRLLAAAAIPVVMIGGFLLRQWLVSWIWDTACVHEFELTGGRKIMLSVRPGVPKMKVRIVEDSACQ